MEGEVSKLIYFTYFHGNQKILASHRKMDKFPPLYDTQDFFECVQNDRTFCVVDAKLGEGIQNSTTWNAILESLRDDFKMDRSYVHRGLCLSTHQSRNLIESVTNKLTNELSHYNLTVGIEMMQCQKGLSSLTAIDIISLLILSSIILSVIIGTIMDPKVKEPRSTIGKILLKFSLKTNWKKIVKTTGGEDFTRLKSMHGFRVLCMFGVIATHALMKTLIIYFHNPELFEEMFSARAIEIASALAIFVVHVFLVMSAFLLVNQIYNHYEKNGCFTFRDVLVLISNRYLRLYIPTLLFITLSTTSFLENISGSPGMKLLRMNKNTCEKSWASTIFFCNNFTPIIEQCYFTTWYLSVDFQAYILIALILYIILKNQLNSLKVMLRILITSILVFAVYIYIKNPKHIVFKGSVSNIQHLVFLRVEDYITLYSSTISTLPTSFTGMVFGYIYYRIKKYKINRNMAYSVAFYSILFGLPGLCVYLSVQNYNRLLTSVIGSLIKVIYSTAAASTIIAMSFGIGGMMKRILESKFFIILGNISFSVYLCNFMCLLVTLMGHTYLETFSAKYMITEFLFEATASIAFGLVLALFVEQPALSLQKMFLPQLRKSKEEQVKKE